MQRNLLLVTVLCIITMLVGCGMAEPELTPYSDDFLPSTSEKSASAYSSSDEVVDVPKSIYVYVCGAVVRPGVYELPASSRAVDAVEAAGGFCDGADEAFVNLAAQLSDGIKLLIPTIEETARSADSPNLSSFDSETASANDLVNINTASKEELKTLPGIGDGIAGRIIEYREESGGFKTTEDIMQVRGIKEKLFSKIKDHITV